VLPLQQPWGHEVASQTHVPFVVSHSLPAPHAAHAAPPAPQEAVDSEAKGSQTLPLQQPFGHDVASHTHPPVLLLHSRPDAHAAQATPPAPHEPVDSEA
jgi:hypothetical protein